jgi:hypothetical protein
MIFSLRKPNPMETKLDHAEFCRMQELILRMANCEYSPDFVVEKANPFRIGMRKRDLDVSKFCFGFTIAANVVSFKSGDVNHATRDPIVVPDTDVTITTDHQYAWVEYTNGSGVAAFHAPNVNKPKSDEDVYRCWIAQFRLDYGVATLERIGHLGNIELPGMYA